MEQIARFRSRSPARIGRLLVIGNALVALLLSAATLSNLSAGRAADLARASEAAGNLASSLGVEVASELNLVDNALVTLAAQWRREAGLSPMAARASLAAAIREQQQLVPFAALVARAAPDAAAAAQGGGTPASPQELAFFEQASQATGRVLSEPLLSPSLGEWSILLARPVLDAQGRPQGVVYAALSSRHFAQLFSRLTLGAEGAVSLRTAGGHRLVARYTIAEPGSTKGLGTDTVSAELQAALARDAESGSYTSATAIDGVERVNAYRRVPGYPLLLVAGTGTAAYADPWTDDALRLWGFTATVFVLVLLGSVYVYRQHQREHEALVYAASLATRQNAMIERERGLKAEVQELAARLQDLYDNAPCAYYSLDANGRFCQVNAVMLRWLGCTQAELIDRLGPADFFSEEGAALFREHLPMLLAHGEIGPREFDLRSRDGSARRVSVSETAVRADDGRFLRSRSVMYDISELDAARRQLGRLAAQQDAMLDNDLIGILKLRERAIVWSNRASEQMFGFTHQEMVGLPARELYPSTAAYEDFGRHAYEALAREGRFRGQLELVKRDGTPLWVDVSGTQLSAEPAEYLWMSLDITAMKRQHERIEHAAFHDALTGLPNRLLMMDRLRHAVQICQRTGGAFAVCFLDLDGFKTVNDTHGHAAGDELLRGIAGRLQQELRAHDTVARVGGDEFIVLLPQLRASTESSEVIARLITAVARPVHLHDGTMVQVRASVGVACWPEDGHDEETLLARADRAMYADKSARRRTRAPN